MPFSKEEIEKFEMEQEKNPQVNTKTQPSSIPEVPQLSYKYSFYDKILLFIASINYFFWVGIAVARDKCSVKDYVDFSDNITKGKFKEKIKRILKAPPKNKFKIKDLTPSPQVDLLR